MDLHIDENELSACVQCGLCLPHCPTFRVTGDEALSPRGRIALMRAVQRDDAPLTPEVIRSFETCIQCRGCETACPSQVHFGHLIEPTRASLAQSAGTVAWWQRLAYLPLSRPRLLRWGSVALAVARRARLAPARLGLPARMPIRRAPLRASGDDVLLFTGCVMDAWQRDIHQAGQHVLEAAGFGVRPTGPQAPCCGTLHLHAGLSRQARRLAQATIDALPGHQPILVDSAGCGAALKDYGRLLGTDDARAFSARVFDIHEWLADRVHLLPPAEPLPLRVAVQDPCHLRHVQRAHHATRQVLERYVHEIVELDDQGLCCGAGGAYAVVEPRLASQVRDRKLAAIARAAPDVVASANPGCSLHLEAGGAVTRHPMSLVWAAISRE